MFDSALVVLSTFFLKVHSAFKPLVSNVSQNLHPIDLYDVALDWNKMAGKTGPMRESMVGLRCKLDPGLKAPPVSKFDCEKGVTVLST